MTVQIRSSVFETNSSSSHSLTLGKSMLAPLVATKEELTAGKIVIKLNSYGWEWARYYDAREKIAYLASQLARYTQDADDAFNAEIDEGSHLDMLRQAVKRQTGCELVFADVMEAGIDHESVGLGLDQFDSMEKLEAFLWDSSAFIETGNDNTEPPNWIRVNNSDEKEWYGQHCMLKEKALGQEVTFMLEVSRHKHYRLVHQESGRVLAAHPLYEALLNRILACPVGMAKMRFEEQIQYKRYHKESCIHKELVQVIDGIRHDRRDSTSAPCTIDINFVNRSSLETVFVDKEYSDLMKDCTISFVLPQALYEEFMALAPLSKAQLRLLDLLMEERDLRARVDAGWDDKSCLTVVQRKLATLARQKVCLPVGAEQ